MVTDRRFPFGGMSACVRMSVAVVLISAFGISMAHGVEITGFGVDRENALNNAFRSAVEAAVGVAVQSSTSVEDFTVIKDEIVTHARGYVTRYKVLGEARDPEAGYRVTIEADVDRGMVSDHVQALDILMKMAGHPKVLVLGIDEDFESVASGTELFDPLVNTVADVFSRKFRFEVVDWPTVRSKYADIPGKLNRERVAEYNHVLRCQYLISVKLNLYGKKDGTSSIRLVLDAVRISDNYLVAKVEREAGVHDFSGLGEESKIRKAVAVAGETVFPASVDVAKMMVSDIQSEVERGKGFRYSLEFYDFPGEPKLTDDLAAIQGYVRLRLERQDATQLRLTYWSNLSSDTLLEEIKGALQRRGHKFSFKHEGRRMRFKWKHPEGF